MLDSRRFLPLGVLLIQLACASDDARVSSTFDPLFRFPPQATYAWDDAANSLPKNSRILQLDPDTLLKQAANDAFSARGYHLASSGAPDYLLSYQLTVSTWIGVDNSTSVGSLSLLMREARSRDRIWTGFGRAEIHVGLTDQERRERMRRTMERMLKKFPPSQRGD